MYRVGFPLWKVAAKAGMPLKIRILAHKDVEAGVFVAYSPDLPGLVAEAETLDALRDEVESSAAELLAFHLSPESVNRTVSELRLEDNLAAA